MDHDYTHFPVLSRLSPNHSDLPAPPKKVKNKIQFMLPIYSLEHG